MSAPTYAYVLDPEAHRPNDAERQHIDRLVAAFVLKKGGPPAGHWRVPGISYCAFYRTRLHHMEQ